VAESYGYALAWLAGQGLLDPGLPPEERWSEDRVQRYIDDLKAQVRPATVKQRILALERAVAVLAPKSDRSLLRSAVCSLPLPPDDGRKRNRLQDSASLVALGLELTDQAERGHHTNPRKNEPIFRDDLQIALLALRGFRKGNFAAIRIDRHLVCEAGTWWLKFTGDETKTHRPLEVPFPEDPVPALLRYLHHYRPLLAGTRYSGDRL
jgi:hypothetical protein